MGSPTTASDKGQPSEDDVRRYLLANLSRNVIRELTRQSADLVVLGDFHVGEFVKSHLLYELLYAAYQKNSLLTHFHASEYLDPVDRAAIDQYLDATTPEQMRKLWHAFPHTKPHYYLTRFLSTITMAAYFGHRHCAILPAGSRIRGDQPGGKEARHKDIFEKFQESIRHHNARSKFTVSNKTARGNFLMGAKHAARSQPGSSAKTTTQLLIDAGWKVHVVRLVVWLPQYSEKDSLPMHARHHRTTLELGPMLMKISNNKDCYIPLAAPGSPFLSLSEPRTSHTPLSSII